MATTVSYAASMVTRKYTSSSNAKSGVASQEFYDSSYNYVGILCFSGMNLANKVITSIWLDIDAAKAGYGAGSSKLAFLRKANYQNSIASGVAGWEYVGDELGTFEGSFYGNSTSYYITGDLFNQMAAYIAQGNNSFTLYNPYASASSHGYSYNYFQWESCVITITYEEAVSQPTVSSTSVNLGSAVTIYTNRQSTGATSAANAIATLGGVKKSGDTMTGNLSISGYLYPSLYLLPTYNSTTNRTVFEGSYAGASSFAAWEDSTGNNRRMLEVRTKAYQNSLDYAVLLRVCDAGTWANYRIFHAGMPSGVPIANGGTGATTAANARSNLGANNASNINAGTLAMARLPFKVAYGSGNVSGNSALSINYSSAGFTSVPCVVVTYSTTGSNWSGDNGALKVHSKTTTGATVIVGGNFNTSRAIDWIAIGV